MTNTKAVQVFKGRRSETRKRIRRSTTLGNGDGGEIRDWSEILGKLGAR